MVAFHLILYDCKLCIASDFNRLLAIRADWTWFQVIPEWFQVISLDFPWLRDCKRLPLIVTHGSWSHFIWLRMVVSNCKWLQTIVGDYSWLYLIPGDFRAISGDFTWLRVIASNCFWLQPWLPWFHVITRWLQ